MTKRRSSVETTEFDSVITRGARRAPSVPNGDNPPETGATVEKQRRADFDELGVSGLKRSGTERSLIEEEFLAELKGERGRKILREMRDNDPTVGAVLFAVEMLVRNVDWEVRGGDDGIRDFVESAFDDMSHTWEETVAEILSMLTFGFSWHEVVYKRRLGESNDPKKKSRFNDGRIGWRKIPIRAQESLHEWRFDEEGGVQAFIQMAEPDFKIVEIPIQRSLLFRVGVHKGNPEGRSILRNAFRPWFLKKTIEEIEAIGIDRDLAGLPVIYRTQRVADKHEAKLKEIVRNVRRHQQEGLILPLVMDENGNKELTFELLSSAGSRQINVTETIDRYDKRILMSVLADFIMLGMSNVGSFALSSSKTNLFAVALGAILKSIAAVINRHAIPDLLAVNGIRTEEPPQFVPGDVEDIDLEEFGTFLQRASGSGMPLFPDDNLENHVRRLVGFPEKSDTLRE